MVPATPRLATALAEEMRWGPHVPPRVRERGAAPNAAPMALAEMMEPAPASCPLKQGSSLAQLAIVAPMATTARHAETHAPLLDPLVPRSEHDVCARPPTARKTVVAAALARRSPAQQLVSRLSIRVQAMGSAWTDLIDQDAVLVIPIGTAQHATFTVHQDCAAANMDWSTPCVNPPTAHANVSEEALVPSAVQLVLNAIRSTGACDAISDAPAVTMVAAIETPERASASRTPSVVIGEVWTAVSAPLDTLVLTAGRRTWSSAPPLSCLPPTVPPGLEETPLSRRPTRNLQVELHSS